MAVEPFNLERTQSLVLYRLFKAIDLDENLQFTTSTLAEEIGVSEQRTELAADDLVERGFCRSEVKEIRQLVPTNMIFRTDTSPYETVQTKMFRVTLSGMEDVRAWPEEKYMEIEAAIRSQSTSGDFEDEAREAPAADRYVQYSDNEKQWEEAKKSVEAFLLEFKRDHPRDNELGADKGLLFAAVENGFELFNDTRMDIEIGLALLVEPLKLIAVRYKDHAISALISVAISEVGKLLGTLS